MLKELKLQIKYDSTKVGPFSFSTYLPPHLCFLLTPPSQEALLNDGIGMTLVFFVAKYPDSKNLDTLLDIFSRKDKITPKFYAQMMIYIAQAIIPYQRFGEKNNRVLKEPSVHYFGSRKIYFKLLGTVIKLSFDHIIGSSQSEHYFKEQEQNWLQFANLACTQKTKSDSVH